MFYVFPGQGSQKIGMCKDIYDNFKTARDVLSTVDDAISFKLSNIIFNGSEDELRNTENTQPALMAICISIVEVLKQEFGQDISEIAKYFAGHSVGEYTALCASGVLDVTDTARLLRLRGKAMSEAYPVGGKMAALIGLDIEIVKELIEKTNRFDNVVQIANDNAQIIISGMENAVNEVCELAEKYKVRKIMVLDVSGPFHTSLMAPAVNKLTEALENITFNDPKVPIISNVTAKHETTNLKKLLIDQLTSTVRWRESILWAAKNGIKECAEIGPGGVLTRMIKRIDPTISIKNISSMTDLEEI